MFQTHLFRTVCNRIFFPCGLCFNASSRFGKKKKKKKKKNYNFFSTDRSKAVVPVLVSLFIALWFILRDDLFYVLPCVILFLCFPVLSALRLPRLEKRELVFLLLVRLFDLRLFGFVCFLFLLMSGKGCGLWLWHSLDFSLTLAFTHTY